MTARSGAMDDRIAARYRALVAQRLRQPPEVADRQARAVAAALHQAGLYRHKLLLLQDVMDRFAARRGAGDPAPAFPGELRRRIGDADPAAAAERHYRLALVLVPAFAEALYALALLRWRAGALAEAEHLFARAAAAQPWDGAPPHEHLAANALWNVAALRADAGDAASVERYREALVRLDNFGVDHAAFAALLRRRGEVAEAAIHYERLMPYSHRYAAEFVEPDYAPAERLPADRDGLPCSPLVPTPVADSRAGTIWYWWHLYFLVPPPTAADTRAALRRVLLEDGWLGWFGRAWRRPSGRVRIALSAAALA